MIKNPSDAAVRRIMKENDVVQSAIQLANSGSIRHAISSGSQAYFQLEQNNF